MKLLMFVVPEARKEEVEVFLDRSGVSGYTEVAPVAGRGETGPRYGSGAYPKTSALIFSFVDDGALEEIRGDLAGFCTDCGPGVHVVSWGAEELM